MTKETKEELDGSIKGSENEIHPILDRVGSILSSLTCGASLVLAPKIEFVKIYLRNCRSKKHKKEVKKDMDKWIDERFGKVSMEHQMKQLILDSSENYRDLLDDCMEGRSDSGARKNCGRKIAVSPMQNIVVRFENL